MKAVVAAFNQEKALVGAFSVITNLRMELFEALVRGLELRPGPGAEQEQGQQRDQPRLLQLGRGHRGQLPRQDRAVHLHTADRQVAAGAAGVCSRMNWWYSTRCDLYRSVRNDVKLTKCHEMLWCEAAWGQLWPILCYEAGHKWTQPTLQCTSCAVCIGRHNCRHYNWLAAVSVLGCLQKQKKTLLSPFAF